MNPIPSDYEQIWDDETQAFHHVKVVTKPTDNRGAHNFKGSMNVGGYILIKVEGHPYANKRGYYPKHRFVVERVIGRFLHKDEVVHHRNGDRKDNDYENLELLENQSQHATIEDRGKRNPNGTFVAADPIFGEIKFRLYDKDRRVTVVYSLQKLIATTFRRAQFEFRGRATGLTDKNGKEIYEGDILVQERYHEDKKLVNHKAVSLGSGAISTDPGSGYEQFYGWTVGEDGDPLNDSLIELQEFYVVGNIYENPELLERDIAPDWLERKLANKNGRADGRRIVG